MQTTIMALLGLASIFVGWILLLILPGIHTIAWGILALGGVLVAVAFIIDFRRVGKALGSRRGKFRIGTTVQITLFVAIILFTNAISEAKYHRFDFTGLEQFTLTSQTKDVLANLNQPVEIISFFTPAVPVAISSYATNLLAEYKNYSGQLNVRDADPDLNPDLARSYGVDQMGAQYGVVVFRSAAGQRQVFGPQIAAQAENAFTSAILEITGTIQKKVYFLTGHGERSIFSDYSDARKGLQENLFKMQELDLMATPGIPADAAAVVVASPQDSPVSDEVEIIKTYLENDGRVCFLLDPNPPPEFRELLSKWGLEVRDGILVDPISNVVPQKDNILVPRIRNAFQLAETHFPGATAIIPMPATPKGVELTPLVWTSLEAWLERGLIPGEAPVFKGPEDVKGPFAIGVMVSYASADQNITKVGTRLVVFGDSDFASNPNFYNGNNSDLFLNSINWLVAGKDIISIDRKVFTTRRLLLSPEQARFFNMSSIGLFPLLLLVMAAYIWWRRSR